MNCLWCDQAVSLEFNWMNIFTLPKSNQLCFSCEEKLALLSGKRCEICSRMSEKSVCSDCQKWSVDPIFKGALTFNYSVFTYNEMMQQMISKWKYRGDYILGEAFSYCFRREFENKFSFLKKDVLLVPIPLSKERLIERGFNQAQVLADLLPVDNIEIMTRLHSEKQAKKTRLQRINTKNPFIMTKKVNKPVILVDDIYTTGATLHHAGKLLKENGCPEVYAFTLIRG